MNEDIFYYYDILEENILKVEDDKTDKEALAKVESSFKALFEFIKLFLIEKKERYDGYIIMCLRLKLDYGYLCQNIDVKEVNLEGERE